MAFKHKPLARRLGLWSFTTYALAGVSTDAVTRHLEAIATAVRAVAPDSIVDSLEVCEAG